MNTLPALRKIILAFSLLALAVTARAQAAAAPTPEPQKKEEILVLSEFSVHAVKDEGYGASETMTGSRVATQIKDLPFTVNVLTSEFFNDFGMFELNENVVQIGGLTGLGIGGAFNLRGFTGTSQLRDGFLRLGRYGASNIDRLEVIKGPNASGLYGRSSPGGMINFISKQPKKQESQKLELSYGSYNTRRALMELTGPIGASAKTSYVATLSEYDRGFDTPIARNHNKEGYLAIAHDFSDSSRLMVSAESFIQVRHAPNAGVPLVTDQKGTAATSDDVVLGYAKNLPLTNAEGPHSELNRGNTSFTATYEKRLSDVWSWRAASNYYRARRWDFNQNTQWGSIAVNPAPGTTSGVGLPAGTIFSARGNMPNRRLIFEDGGGFQSDLVAHTFFGNHSVESKTLFTVDINDYYRYDPIWNFGPAFTGSTNVDPVLNAWSTARIVPLNADYTPVGPVAYFPSDYIRGQATFNQLQRMRTTTMGGLFRQQTIFFNGRLLTYAGGRYDSARFTGQDTNPTALNGAPVSYHNKKLSAFKPNAGFNFKIRDNLRVYANYSESYFIDQTTAPNQVVIPDFKFESAAGYDFGIKGSLLDDRLNFTLGGYYIDRNNVQVSELVESPAGSGNFVTQNLRDGDQLVRGWEADVTWAINADWSFLGSFGNVNSKYTNFGTASPRSVGRNVNGVSPENGGLSLRYTPRSTALKGFSANLGATYVSSTPSEVPNAGDNYSTVAGVRVFNFSTGQWALRIPSYTLWNVGLRYTFRHESRYAQTIALNVNNVFDKFYISTGKTLGESRGIFVSYSITRGAAH
jgi:outer membrane receptor protein involved in Fe transport